MQKVKVKTIKTSILTINLPFNSRINYIAKNVLFNCLEIKQVLLNNKADKFLTPIPLWYYGDK